MKKNLLTFSVPLAALGISAVTAVGAQTPAPSSAPVCEHDVTVQERFIPVEMLTGNPMPDGQGVPALTFSPVDRTYPFWSSSPGGAGTVMETQLKGPVQWVGEGGKAYEVYERKVPRAHERFALTPDRTAIGRVYDDRWGNATNEGKFPVGQWKQGQKRVYDTLYHGSSQGSRSLQTSVEIEKLSCTYEGIAGAVQYRWKTTHGLDYVYVYAPVRGLVQVVTYSRGR